MKMLLCNRLPEGENTSRCIPSKMTVECMHASDVAAQYELQLPFHSRLRCARRAKRIKVGTTFAPRINMSTSKTPEDIMHAYQRFSHQSKRVAFIVASYPPLVPSSQSDRSQRKVIPPSFVASTRSDPVG